MAKTSVRLKWQRNPHACAEHKRKHEKCPISCPGKYKGPLPKKRGRKRKNKGLLDEELNFVVFCTAIESLIEKFPTLHRDGDLSIKDCIREMYIK